MEKRASSSKRWLIWLYSAFAAFVMLGFLMPGDNVPGLFTWRSATFIAGIALVAVLVLVPLLWLLPFPRQSIRPFQLTTLLVLTLGAVSYVIGSTYYYATQHHQFDPFLQIRPLEAEAVLPDTTGAVLRVAAIGGSTTRDLGKPVERRYPQILQRELGTRVGTPVIVATAGMDWWTTKHSMIDYMSRLAQWQPHVVVILHGINDLYRSFAPPEFAIGGYREDWAHFYGPAARGARPPAYYRHLLNQFGAVPLTRWYARFRFVERDYGLDTYRSLPQFESYLRQLVRIVRWSGAEPILLTQPFLYRDDMTDEERAVLSFGWMFCNSRSGRLRREFPTSTSLMRAMEAYNAVVARVAAEEKVLLVDLAAAMPRDLEHFTDDVHFAEAGSALVGHTVAAALAERMGGSVMKETAE